MFQFMGPVFLYFFQNGDVNFISRPSQKDLSDTSGVLRILENLPLSAASAVALNEHH